MDNSLNNHLADYISKYTNSEKTFSSAVRDLKADAISNFKNLGFPTTRNEEWKYTNVAGLLKNDFTDSGNELHLTKKDIESFLPKEVNGIVLVFENGKFSKQLSNIENLPKGIVAGNLKDHLDHSAVKNYLGKIALHKSESFVALNTALFHDGAFIYADKNIICDSVFHLVFINDSTGNATVSCPRNFVFASVGSSLKISESYYSIDSINPAFCNPVTEIFIDENASVEFCKNESENSIDYHIDYTSVFLRKNSTLHIHTITIGGNLVRNNLRIELQDQNGAAYLNGLYVTSGESHVDNHSFVDHSSRDCYSNELYKGVLDEKSRGVFNGKIFVRRDAQKTNAYQSNKNIILSDDASVNAKPQLEIYADDVKCSHGATTGQIDNEAMFYLRSRGIGITEAQALLTNAFADEILDKISMISTRDLIKNLVHQKLNKDND